MQFHHVCLVVSDIKKALNLYCDVLGFSPYIDTVIPDGDGPQALFSQSTLDDIFHVRGARSHMVMLVSPEGAKIELQQPSVPKVESVEKEQLRYGYVGISELAFRVQGIDAWFEKIRASGFETQTNYVWAVASGRLRSFLFYDFDGNMIQLCEEFTVSDGT